MHKLTDSQQKYVRDLIQQAQAAQRQLQWFLNYVVDEAGLPKVPYSLSDDGTTLEPEENKPRERIVLPEPQAS